MREIFKTVQKNFSTAKTEIQVQLFVFVYWHVTNDMAQKVSLLQHIKAVQPTLHSTSKQNTPTLPSHHGPVIVHINMETFHPNPTPQPRGRRES